MVKYDDCYGDEMYTQVIDALVGIGVSIPRSENLNRRQNF